MRGSLDVWVKKQYMAKDQSDAENHEPVTVVQDGVSNPINTELELVVIIRMKFVAKIDSK